MKAFALITALASVLSHNAFGASQESFKVFEMPPNPHCNKGAELVISYQRVGASLRPSTLSLSDFVVGQCERYVDANRRGYLVSDRTVDGCGIVTLKAVSANDAARDSSSVIVVDNRGNTCPTFIPLPEVLVEETKDGVTTVRETRFE